MRTRTSATCTPSRYSLLTGEYAWRKRGTGVLPGDANAGDRAGARDAAGDAAAGGIPHGRVGKWHLGMGKGKVGLERRDPARPARDRVRLLVHHAGDRRPRAVRVRREPAGGEPRPEGPDPRRLRKADRRRADRQEQPGTAQDAPEPRPRHGDRQRRLAHRLHDGRQEGALGGRDMAETFAGKAVELHRAEQGAAVLPLLRDARHPRAAPAEQALRRQDADGPARRRHRGARLDGRPGARRARPQRPDATTRW